MKTQISFVVTSYNRAHTILNTIESLLKQINFNQLCEIVIVDDASIDNTIKIIKKNYSKEINNNIVKLISLDQNIGVSGAKNQGYQVSKFDWVIFLDSDDLLIDNILEQMIEILNNNHTLPIVFFRCIDQYGDFVGKKFNNDKLIDIEEYIEKTSYGEALTAINKKIVQSEPYIQELRGYERLGCSRIINNNGSSLLSNLVARVYITEGEDRLSVGSGFIKRLPLLAKGHLFMLKEFSKYMSLKQKSSYFIKMIIYYIVGNIMKKVIK